MTTKPPERSIGRAIYRLREQGLAWIVRRLAHEWSEPSTAPGRMVFRLRGLAHRLKRYRQAGRIKDRSESAALRVYAFYDLAVSPVTYDVLWLIVGAELMRRRLGLREVHFVLVPGPNQGVRSESAAYERVIDPEARRLRLFNITLPAFSLLASTTGITVASSREDARILRDRAEHVYPPRYEVDLPYFPHPCEIIDQAAKGVRCQVLRAPADARRAIDRWREQVAGTRRIVTITLRTYDFGSARNSNIDSWGRFAAGLDPKVWCVVFLADTARTFDPPPAGLAGFSFLHEASWNLPLRMALYEAAWINLGVNTGPLMYAAFSAARGAMFRMINEDVDQTSDAYVRSQGFVPGEQPPFTHPLFRLVWDPDTEDVIRSEFDRLCETISSGGP